MKLKNAVKGNRVPFRVAIGSKAPTSGVEVITENVLVPVTKTIFTKRQCKTNCTKRNVKLVKSYRSNGNVIGPLLKRPSNSPMKTHTGTMLQIEQNDGKRNNRKKRKKSKESFREAEKSSKFRANDRAERPHRQTPNQKERQRIELPFPCPISALPEAASFATRPSFAMDESTIEFSNTTSRNDKASGETKKANTRERFRPKKRRNVGTIRSLFRDSLKSPTVSANWNVPITSSIITTTTTSTTNDIVAGYCLIPYRDSTSTKIDAIGKRALSTSVVGPRAASRRAMELSTSSNFLETRDRSASLQLSAQNAGSLNGDMVDRSAFKFLAGDPTKSYQTPCIPEPERPCEIKYSWQVIGRSSQTSRTLLDSFIETNNFDEPSQPCRVKYSWQIIGIATQTCERDFAIEERHMIAPFSIAKSPRNRRDSTRSNDAQPSTVWRNGKKFIILNNQCTQTIAHKANQSNFAEMHATYH